MKARAKKYKAIPTTNNSLAETDQIPIIDIGKMLLVKKTPYHLWLKKYIKLVKKLASFL